MMPHRSPAHQPAVYSLNCLEFVRKAHGRRERRPTQRRRIQPSRISRLTIITTSEKATQKSTTRPHLSVRHTGFLWALCQELVLSTTQRFVAPSGACRPRHPGLLPRARRRPGRRPDGWHSSRIKVPIVVVTLQWRRCASSHYLVRAQQTSYLIRGSSFRTSTGRISWL